MYLFFRHGYDVPRGGQLSLRLVECEERPVQRVLLAVLVDEELECPAVAPALADPLALARRGRAAGPDLKAALHVVLVVDLLPRDPRLQREEVRRGERRGGEGRGGDTNMIG
jgi:hypothetical protein